MRARVFERWVVLCTATFTLLSSVALRSAFSDQPFLSLTPRHSEESLISRIESGAGFTLRLDPGACDDPAMGQLSCTTPYFGYYERRNNAWVLTGKTNLSDQQILTNTIKDVPKESGKLSIWGVPATFDERGNLTMLGKVRGTISISGRNSYR